MVIVYVNFETKRSVRELWLVLFFMSVTVSSAACLASSAKQPKFNVMFLRNGFKISATGFGQSCIVYGSSLQRKNEFQNTHVLFLFKYLVYPGVGMWSFTLPNGVSWYEDENLGAGKLSVLLCLSKPTTNFFAKRYCSWWSTTTFSTRRELLLFSLWPTWIISVR